MSQLILQTGNFLPELVDDLYLWVNVLSRLIRDETGLHSIVQRA